MKVAGSGFKGEGAAAGAGRRSVFNNVAGAVIGEYLKSPVSKVAGNGIFKMSQSQSPAAAPAIRGMVPIQITAIVYNDTLEISLISIIFYLTIFSQIISNKIAS